MDRYIGLDVHANSCTVAIVGPSGRRPFAGGQTNGAALIERFERFLVLGMYVSRRNSSGGSTRCSSTRGRARVTCAATSDGQKSDQPRLCPGGCAAARQLRLPSIQGTASVIEAPRVGARL
jgi:hypothetical protein